MNTEIRVLDNEDDLIAAANVFRTAMVGFPPLSNLAPGQITRLLEPGRTIGAFVKGQLVGTADAVTSRLTLPGGAIVSHAAVTHIGVLPSFTRKGIATDLIGHQLDDIAARGEVVATLRASEATIYERYGYGVASSSQTVEVRTARATPRYRGRWSGATAGRGRSVGRPASHLRRQSPVPSGHHRSSSGVVAGSADAQRILLGAFICRGAR
jgi:GNAT superfamily N-acetyltransferase